MMADKRNPVNPKEAKAEERAINNAPKTPTLAEVAQLTFEAKKGELKADGAAGRWMSPLNHHVLPKLGTDPVDKVTRDTIKRTLSAKPVRRLNPPKHPKMRTIK
jgi:hypothetical protein